MVVYRMGWISEMGSRVGDHLKRSSNITGCNNSATIRVGILAFETAKTMSRLVSLYKSLDEEEILNFRREVVKSGGVSCLNLKDETFVLTLACAERLEDLDKAATTIARLGHKCSDFGLNRFDIVYTDLKKGIIDLGKLEYGSKESQRTIEKMEKLVSATSRLYTALESLSEMEISERKLSKWKQNSRMAFQAQTINSDLFNQKINFQRKQVRHFRETSLWSQTFDKSVGLMARMVCIIYARICYVFEPIRLQVITTRSGPIPTVTKPKLLRFHSQKSVQFLTHSGTNCSNNRVFQAAGPATLGGSGLAMRYANLIIMLERYLDLEVMIEDDAREALYDMLPENLKIMVRTKLGKNVRAWEEGGGGEFPAERWNEALREIMGWLGPVAHDTVKWQSERSFEKMKFQAKPPVLLLQTLHFCDKEKVEAAVVELLVGLSCIYRFQNRRICGGSENRSGCDGESVVSGRCSFDGFGWSKV